MSVINYPSLCSLLRSDLFVRNGYAHVSRPFCQGTGNGIQQRQGVPEREGEDHDDDTKDDSARYCAVLACPDVCPIWEQGDDPSRDVYPDSRCAL